MRTREGTINKIAIPSFLTVFLISSIFTAGQIFHKVNTTDEKLTKVEEKTEKSEDKIEDIEKVDLRQSIILDGVVDTLNKLNEKIDRGE